MTATYYQTVNGRLESQTTEGVQRDYLTDALGSVTAAVNASGAIENTYRYKPYGDRLAKTGTAADPRFQWTGDTGSRNTGKKAAEQYNRRRHYGSPHATWISVDPLWPWELGYVYVRGEPTLYADPFGLAPCLAPKECCCTIVSFDTRESVVNTPTKWGHEFTVNIKTRRRFIKDGEKPATCKLRWLEKAALTVNAGVPTNVWYDASNYARYFGVAPWDDFARSIPTGCESDTATFRFVDPPGISPPPGWTGSLTQKLCIRAVVLDGCTGKETTKTFWQKLVVKNGKLTAIKPPGSSSDMTTYCKYP